MIKKLILLAACVALPFAGCADAKNADTDKADATTKTGVSESSPPATT